MYKDQRDSLKEILRQINALLVDLGEQLDIDVENEIGRAEAKARLKRAGDKAANFLAWVTVVQIVNKPLPYEVGLVINTDTLKTHLVYDWRNLARYDDFQLVEKLVEDIRESYINQTAWEGTSPARRGESEDESE
jgi:hypothetical protein